MSTNYAQCKGITKKGQRCKLPGKTNGYCHYHINQPKQPPPSPLPSSTSHLKKDRGYIYIYTMTNFLTPPKNWLFKVKNIPNTSRFKRDKWIEFNSKKSPYILIKIGKTTQSVNARIAQWENKCGHDLTNLEPKNRNLVKKEGAISGLIRMFRRLDVVDDDERRNEYRTYRNNGFYCGSNLDVVESSIHKVLRHKYGKGDVYCVGCNNEPVKVNDKSSPFDTNYNVHIEWFLIPKTDLEYVYKLIDSTCINQASR